MIAQKGGQSLLDVSRRIERRALCFGKEGKHGWPAFRFMRDGVQSAERTPDFIAFPAPQTVPGRWRFEAARFRPTGIGLRLRFSRSVPDSHITRKVDLVSNCHQMHIKPIEKLCMRPNRSNVEKQDLTIENRRRNIILLTNYKKTVI